MKKLSILIIISVLSFGCLPIPNPGAGQSTMPVSFNGTIPISSNSTIPVSIVSSNTTLSVNMSTNNTMVFAKPYYVGIAEKEIADHVPWAKTGFNPNVGTTEEDMWYGSSPYVFPAVAQKMKVVSTSAQDGVAGSGIQSVWINYLDGNYAEKTTTVTMNGLTSANTTVTDIFRIQNFRALTTGNTYKAAGDIAISNFDAVPIVYSYIATGYTRARNNCYTVPAGKTLYVTNIAFSTADKTGGKAVRFTTRATYDSARDAMLTPGLFFMAYNEVVLIQTAYSRELTIPTRLPEKTDIKISVIADSAGAVATSTLTGWLEKN